MESMLVNPRRGQQVAHYSERSNHIRHINVMLIFLGFVVDLKICSTCFYFILVAIPPTLDHLSCQSYGTLVPLPLPLSMKIELQFMSTSNICLVFYAFYSYVDPNVQPNILSTIQSNISCVVKCYAFHWSPLCCYCSKHRTIFMLQLHHIASQDEQFLNPYSIDNLRTQIQCAYFFQ